MCFVYCVGSKTSAWDDWPEVCQLQQESSCGSFIKPLLVANELLKVMRCVFLPHMIEGDIGYYSLFFGADL